MPKTLAASNIPGLPIASSLQAEQSLRQFLRLYDDNKFPIRLVESSSQRADRRKLQWLVGLGDLSAAERRQLIHGFANGLPVEKQVWVGSIFGKIMPISALQSCGSSSIERPHGHAKWGARSG